MATAGVTQQRPQMAVEFADVWLKLELVVNTGDQRGLQRGGVGDPFGHRGAAVALGAERCKAPRHPAAGRAFRFE